MRKSTEEGFVLIAAIWLLLLGAAIAALLMLRSMNAARTLHSEDDLLASEQADTDAVELVAADLVFDGPRSRWAQLPAHGDLTVDGHPVTVTLTAEESRPDVNKADLTLIDRALQDHGLPSSERTQLIGRIADTRNRGRKIASFAELAALGHGIVAPGTEDCLASTLSPFGGIAPGGGYGSTPRAGSVLRLAVSTGPVQRIHALRLVPANDRSYGLLDQYDDGCQVADRPASLSS